MAAAVHDSIDLGAAGSYPVYLSDALQGKGTKDVFTSVRYDQKPTPSSDSSLTGARITPAGGRGEKYDMTFYDDDEEYTYQGTRQSSDDQYVLVFDPARKAFILHQVDSTFEMNLKSGGDLEPSAGSGRGKGAGAGSGAGRKKPTADGAEGRAGAGTSTKNAAAARKKAAEKPKKAKPPPREATPDAEEEDSDGDLLVEYPDSQPPAHFASRPMNPFRREPSIESVEGESDADYDMDAANEPDEDVDHLQLPDPAFHGNGGDVDTSMMDDLENDLEADLLEALEGGQANRDDESSESEEE